MKNKVSSLYKNSGDSNSRVCYLTNVICAYINGLQEILA
jgi:hypothetical protein